MEPFIWVLEAHYTHLNSSVEVQCHFEFSTGRISKQGCQTAHKLKIEFCSHIITLPFNRVMIAHYPSTFLE